MHFMFPSILKKTKPIHLVFFPGIGCKERIFQKIAQQFLDYDVIVHYEHTSNNDKLSCISADCANRLLKSIGKEKAIAVGHSLGGINAAMTVDTAPELFQGLVLCNTRYRPVNTLERHAKNAIIKKISHYTEEQFDKLLCRAFFRNQETLLTEEEVVLLINEARSTGIQTFLQQINLSMQDVSPNYQRILARLPITVIQGIDDTVIPDPGWKESGLREHTAKHSLDLIQCSGGHLSVLRHSDLIASQIKEMIIAENNWPQPSF